MLRLATGVLLGVAVALILGLLAGAVIDYVFPPSPTIDLRPELAKDLPGATSLLGRLLKIFAWTGATFLGARLSFDRSAGEERAAWGVGGAVAVVFLGLGLALFAHTPILDLLATLAVIAASAWGAGRLPLRA